MERANFNPFDHLRQSRGRSPKVAVFGEAMAELSEIGSGRCRFGVAGDTFNTAVYLARAGIDVAHATCLGLDPVSDIIASRIGYEGIDTSMILRATGTPGIYAISVDDAGERSFTYWRSNSVARDFFRIDGAALMLERASSADVLYLTGITLSLFSPAEVTELGKLAAEVRRNGGIVAFDTNYRPSGWSSREAACAAIGQLAPHVTLALPTFEDDALLFGDSDAEATARRWHEWGASETVVKRGSCGALVDGSTWIAPPRVVQPVDTTGAGDSFNGAYIAARLRGEDALMATNDAHTLAAEVIMVPGAILPSLDTSKNCHIQKNS